MRESTILVVDDETFFRRLYSELLDDDGYRVKAAASGGEALEILRAESIDIVLSDMVMPGIDGLELLRQTRSLDNPPEVILATGHATLETAIQALKNGARDYLVKPFNPEELRHLVRTCLEQRRLLDENILLKSQISLFQKGQNLASMIEIGRLLPQAVATLLQELGTGRGFGVLTGRNGDYGLHGLQGLAEEDALALAAALLGGPAKELRPAVLQSGDLPAAPPGTDLRGLMFYPLRCQGNLKGALVLCNDPGRNLPLNHQEALNFLAEQAALGFDNAFRYQGARELMYTDDLTALYNHRYLQLALDREMRRADRYGLEFSLVFIDLDFFKQVNDTHGHLAGSKALREVADLLLGSVREVDSLFRYGGDEFTALLVETDPRGAAVVAERMRNNIEQHTFLSEEGINARMTATVGFACFPADAGSKQELLNLADRAMYAGKKVRNISRGAAEGTG